MYGILTHTTHTHTHTQLNKEKKTIDTIDTYTATTYILIQIKKK